MVVLDIGIKYNVVIDKFYHHLEQTYGSFLYTTPVSYRHYIDLELKKFKATFVTDDSTYRKIYFDSEQYKTLFLLRFS